MTAVEKTIEPIAVASDPLPDQPTNRLSHLPGPEGHWLTGNIGSLMPNPAPYLRQMVDAHGPCFTVGFFRNQRVLMMVGPEANERVLLDRSQDFSNRQGWSVVRPFFGNNIIVRDFADHRQHRQLMTEVFKSEALETYLAQMHGIVGRYVDTLVGDVDVYTQAKALALDLAIRVFMGIRDDQQVAVWNEDLSTVLANVMAHPVRFPGTRFWRGLRARDRLRVRLQDEFERRQGLSGDDLFTHLVNQTDADGRRLARQDVVDHMFGILFAAHDTTASTMAMMFWLFARHPDWQRRIREECEQVYGECGSLELPFAQQAQLPILEAFMKETLRMYAPIQFIPRRSVRAFEFAGYRVPANTQVMVSPQVTHFDPTLYPAPLSFDPGRFLDGEMPPSNFAFVPFGRGSHMCLGMRFAYMEVKAVVYRLLLTRELREAAGGDPQLEYLPVVRPQKRMGVTFVERAGASGRSESTSA